LGRKKDKLVYGVGVNDADYAVTGYVMRDGRRKQTLCPIYAKWKDMLKRCYCEKAIKRRPTYTECYVCDSWLYFSNFRDWVISQKDKDWKEKHLDKDILYAGNKEYSPETCVFVSFSLNMLDTGFNDKDGSLRGASFCNTYKKYKSRCNCPVTGKRVSLGYYETELEAHLAWKAYKHKIALSLAELETDERVSNRLKLMYK